MYIIITYTDEDSGLLLASHAVHSETLNQIVLPQEPVWTLGKFNNEMGEWILAT